jgi:hypothetical protein
MARSTRLILLVIAMGTIGFFNTHTDEVPIVLTTVVALGFGLGVLAAYRPWLLALSLGLALPASQLLCMAFGWHVPYPNTWSGVLISFVAVVPGLIGAYTGASLRWLMVHA